MPPRRSLPTLRPWAPLLALLALGARGAAPGPADMRTGPVPSREPPSAAPAGPAAVMPAGPAAVMSAGPAAAASEGPVAPGPRPGTRLTYRAPGPPGAGTLVQVDYGGAESGWPTVTTWMEVRVPGAQSGASPGATAGDLAWALAARHTPAPGAGPSAGGFPPAEGPGGFWADPAALAAIADGARPPGWAAERGPWSCAGRVHVAWALLADDGSRWVYDAGTGVLLERAGPRATGSPLGPAGDLVLLGARERCLRWDPAGDLPVCLDRDPFTGATLWLAGSPVDPVGSTRAAGDPARPARARLVERTPAACIASDYDRATGAWLRSAVQLTLATAQ